MLIQIIAVIFVFTLVIISHELGHFIAAKRMGVRVEIFSLGFGPKLFALNKGGTEYRLSLIPVGGYVKMAGDELEAGLTGAEWEFYSKPIIKRFNILIAGSAVNYIVGFLLFCLAFSVGAPIKTSHIGAVLDGYPAKESGLIAGDRIMSIDGTTVDSWDKVLELIRSKSEEISIIVKRGEELIDFSVKTKAVDQKDLFGKPVKAMIGIAPSNNVEFVRYAGLMPVTMAAKETAKLTYMTYWFLWKLITRSVSMELVGGPIMIAAVTGEAARLGVNYLIWVCAVISASLALFNLLPFPVLDGGHLLFLIIEKIKGRPVEAKVQNIAQQAAMFLLILFMLAVSWNDVMRFLK